MSGPSASLSGCRSIAVSLIALLSLGCAARGEEDNAGYTQISPASDGGDADGPGGTGGATGGSGGTSAEGGSGGTSAEGGSGGTSAEGGSGGTSEGGSGGTSQGGSGGTSQGGSGGTSAGGGSGGTFTGGSAGSGGVAGTGGSGGTGGSAGTGGSGGTAGSCMHDDDEPNDTDATPQVLDSINDCDNNGDVIGGTLEGGGDKDWFTFHGDDDFGCTVNPSFTLQSSASALMCAYFICDNGGDNINCPTGSSVDTSPGGLSGCCTTTGAMQPDINCSGTDDSAQVYFLVYAPSNTGCQSYSVNYHY